MTADLIRPAAVGDPACPAEHLKDLLGGEEAAAMRAHGARRLLLLAVGGLSLATGVVGMFVPVLPTTCFLLLAAWCFGKSSPRMHRWMYHNRWFGSYLDDYRSGRGVPRAVKVGSLTVLWAGIGMTVVFAVSAVWLRVLLLGIAAAVTAHVALLRDSRTLAGDRAP